MVCSPLLVGITEPLEVLRVVRDHPILCYSEPPQAFYPLQERGWVEYAGGHWRITEEGRAVAGVPSASDEPTTLTEFFEL
jgi:hypothetical protein